VRFWLQKGLGENKVRDYNIITYEVEPDDHELDAWPQ
jgi:hypothetical protein